MVTTHQPVRTGVTYEEWLCLPETNQPHEILDGDLYMSPAPTFGHQQRIARLFSRLDAFVASDNLGIVLTAPLDIVIQKEPALRTRQPDIAFFSTARTGVSPEDDADVLQEREAVPDLIIEMLSPDERRRHLEGKLGDYAAIGVPEVWLVSSEGETVEMLQLKAGAYERSSLNGVGDLVQSEVLSGLQLPVSAIFGRV